MNKHILRKYKFNCTKCLEASKEESKLKTHISNAHSDAQTQQQDSTVGANGSSCKAINAGGLWKFLTVRQIYPLSNQS